MDPNGLPLMLTGVVLMFLALRARTGRLPRNGWAGIRLPRTMRSEEAWKAAHRASWLLTFLSGLVVGAGGAVVLFQAADNAIVVPGAVSSSLLLLLMGTVQAIARQRADSRTSHNS